MVKRLTLTFFRPCCQRISTSTGPWHEACAHTATTALRAASRAAAARLPPCRRRRSRWPAAGRGGTPPTATPGKVLRRSQAAVQFQRNLGDQDHRQPEFGNGDAERGQHADHLVDPAVRLDRSNYAHRNAADEREHQRNGDDQQRVGKGAGDRVRNLLAGQQRLREIPLHRVAEPGAVLHEERPVEPVDFPDLGDAGVGGVLAGECHGDVAGHQLEQREHHEGREQHHRQRLQQAAADDLRRTSPRHRSALQPDVVVFRLAEQVGFVALHSLVHCDQFELEGKRTHERILHDDALYFLEGLLARLDVFGGARLLQGRSSSGGTGARPALK